MFVIIDFWCLRLLVKVVSGVVSVVVAVVVGAGVGSVSLVVTIVVGSGGGGGCCWWFCCFFLFGPLGLRMPCRALTSGALSGSCPCCRGCPCSSPFVVILVCYY